MQNLFSVYSGARHLPGLALTLGLLAGSTAAQAQASAVYGLGTFTSNYTAFGQTATAGTQVISRIDPNNPSAIVLPQAIVGVTLGQLVAIDMRPNTGQLYGLSYNNAAGTSPNAQVYLLTFGPSAVAATPVGNPITLNLGPSARTDLNNYNLVVGVGFDFNPRTDLIQVTGLNRSNYQLSPTTGQIVATDGQLTYAATGNAAGVTLPDPPQVGTVAFENAMPGLTTTTLYAIDQTPGNGVLATQSLAPAPTGVLTAQASVKLGPVGIGDSDFDLDIYTDPTTHVNTAYLLELTGPTANSKGSSNLWTLEIAGANKGTATSKGNIVGGVPLRFTNIAVALTKTPAVWTGTVSTDWGTPGNWSTNTVPTATDDAFIPGPGLLVPNQPTVSNTQQVRSVALGVGTSGQPAVLTTANGGTLRVYGNFVNNDGMVAGSGSGAVSLVGATVQDIGGQHISQFQNLLVGSAGATLNAPASVQAGLTLTGNLAIGTDQPFTLLSNAAGTAYVVNSGGVVTGKATVQRYITPTNPGLGYRHYSAPVTDTNVDDLRTTTFSPVFNDLYNHSATPGAVTPFPTVYGYNQAQYESSPATTITTDFDKGYYSPSGPGDPMPSGIGFTVNLRGDELVDFNGTLANGDFSTPPQGRSAKPNAGWQLLGNPYPSSLDWDEVAKSGLSEMDNAVYVFKSTGQYTGTYASYVNKVGTNGGTNVIPVAQGFFARTAQNSVNGGHINFKNSQRFTTNASAAFQRTTADTRPLALLELTNGVAASQTAVYFERGATAGYDGAYDASALPFLNGLVLASQAGNDQLAINGLPELTSAVSVPLQVAASTPGTYSLRAVQLANLPAGYHAYLQDQAQNTYTDLATTPTVTLNLDASTSLGRYALLFATASPLATAPATLAAQVAVYPSPATAKATLVLPQALRGTARSTVQLLNTLGQAVLTREVAAGGPDAIELPLTGLAAGVYTVRVATAAGLVAKRLVIQ